MKFPLGLQSESLVKLPQPHTKPTVMARKTEAAGYLGMLIPTGN